ncbi:hypothetical protein QYF36_018686 [Acer negundo]|nr:hypothetical protein QYF36_018686 [Acer negundo]
MVNSGSNNSIKKKGCALTKQDFLPEESFQSLGNYAKALSSTKTRLKDRLLARSDDNLELHAMRARSEHEMKKTLNWFDLIWFGIGAVMGVGIFVLTGEAARNDAGPALVISYLISGTSALLSVLCYTQFSVELPVAGGSFAYLRVELGDFIAYIAAGNILFEYVVAGASVASPCLSVLHPRRSSPLLSSPLLSSPLLSIINRLASAAPNTHFSFFNTAESNNSLFSTNKHYFLPNVKAYNVSNGVPEGYVFIGKPREDIELFMKVAPDTLRKAVAEAEAEIRRKVSCLVNDGFLWFAAKMAEEVALLVVRISSGKQQDFKVLKNEKMSSLNSFQLCQKCASETCNQVSPYATSNGPETTTRRSSCH